MTFMMKKAISIIVSIVVLQTAFNHLDSVLKQTLDQAGGMIQSYCTDTVTQTDFNSVLSD